jgi:hypothetical protein
MTKKVEDTESAVSTEDEEVDDSSEDEEDSADDKEVGTKKKPQRGILRRIEKLVVEKHDLQKRVAELEANLKQNVQQQVDQVVGDFQFDEPEPRWDDFGTLAEFNKAVARWEFKRLKAEEAFMAEKASIESQVETIAKRWDELEKAARKELPDYSKVVTVERVAEANPSDLAKQALAESDLGPKIAYHLLNDEDLLEEFSNASPAKQVKILTKIETRLESESEAEEPNKATVTSKPKLPAPLPKGKPTAVSLDLIRDADKLSDEEWSRLYEAQRRKK